MASIRKRNWKTAKGKERTAYTVDYTDSYGGRQRKQFVRWKEADSFRIKIEGQLSKGTYRPDAEKLTAREACEAFLEHCDGRMRRNERMTRKMLTVYRGHVKNYILDPRHGLARYKLNHLTARNVGDFRDRVRTAGVSVPTTRKILSTLHVALEYAISQDWLAVNAAHGVKVIGSRDEGSKRIIPPTKDQMKTILKAANEDTQFMILFAASTGLRAGEQWALRWADINFEQSTLRVLRRVDSYGEEGPPKSAAGVRDVPLSEHLLYKLRERRIRSPYSANEDLIFANKRGSHTCHDNMVKRRFRPAVLIAEKPNINWHSLRHYAISTWIEAGLAPKTIQTFAGHSSLQVTMDRYGHLFPSADHNRTMDKIADDLIGRI